MHIRGEGGAVFELSLPLHEDIATRLFKGSLRRVNADGSDWTDTVERARPAVADRKADWVSWAVHKGCPVDDAEAATKTDLIELYGI
jgi:hypothetical protein